VSLRKARSLIQSSKILVLALAFGSSCNLYAQQAPSDQSYPALGHVFEAKFGDRAFKLVFDSNKKEMTFTRLDGSSETVAYTAKELRPALFLVYWKEPVSGNAVTHIEDFEKSTVDTNIATKDGKFFNLHGTWKRLD
jgi:hypothetical protein